MANYEATKYNFNGSDLTGIEGIPTATIVPWSSSSVPSGFLECNGAAVSRSTYSALFSVVSTTYGVGDGSSTFNVPNLADNVAVGKSGNKALASTGGANTVAVASSGNVGTNTSTNTSINVTGNVGGSTANASLSTAQLASHTHNPSSLRKQGTQVGNQGFNIGTATMIADANQKAALALNNAGSGSGHSHNMSANFSGSGNASSSSSSSSSFSGGTANPSVLQPYLALIYIIKT